MAEWLRKKRDCGGAARAIGRCRRACLALAALPVAAGLAGGAQAAEPLSPGDSRQPAGPPPAEITFAGPAAASVGLDRPIGSVRADIAPPAGRIPQGTAEQAVSALSAAPNVLNVYGSPVYLPYCWEPPGLMHEPLYFEEVNLERYGTTRCGLRPLQPVISGSRFFATVPALPYLMAARPPCERIYTLGEERPGDCVPFRRHWPELRPTAAGVQAAAVTGAVFLIP